MSSRKADDAPSKSYVGMALSERIQGCIEQLKISADQLRQSRNDTDVSRVAQETIDFLKHWLKSFQITASRSL